MKEVHSNMYSLNLYYIIKLLMEMPGTLIPIFISTTIVYFAANLESNIANYLFFGKIIII